MNIQATTPVLKDTKEIAHIIRATAEHVKLSRQTGELLGVKAPPHYKFGRRVMYDLNDINKWLAGRRMGGA